VWGKAAKKTTFENKHDEESYVSGGTSMMCILIESKGTTLKDVRFKSFTILFIKLVFSFHIDD